MLHLPHFKMSTGHIYTEMMPGGRYNNSNVKPLLHGARRLVALQLSSRHQNAFASLAPA